jgi:hypothetical protein
MTENERIKTYYLNNPDKRKLAQQKYYLRNKEKLNKQSIEYRKNNKEKVNRKNNETTKLRKKLDPVYKLKCGFRRNISMFIKRKGYSKKSKSHIILGCTFEHFKLHIESKFEPWMNWENYGLYNGELNYGWDIDHIIPLSTATCEDDIVILNNYTNLQPLCSKINRDIKKDSLLK